MPQQAPTFEDVFVDVLGTRVHLLHAGSGRPVLLIHGLVGSSANWQRSIGALAGGASVYAIDQVNMGKSQRIRGLDPGLEATADRVVATMDALGLVDADMVGHSHGGAVALMLAARHPERVRSLILFAPANPYSHVGDRLARMYNTRTGRLLAQAGPYLPRRMQLAALGRMYGDPARIADGCLENYRAGLRVPGTMQHILAIVRDWFIEMVKLEAALPQIGRVPVLLVWGDRDRAVDRTSAAQLQRVLPQAELRVIRGAGHVAFEEMPDEANQIMLEWLGRESDLRLAVRRGSASVV